MRMFNTTVGRLVLTACVAGLIAAAIGGVSLARAGGTNQGRTIRLTEVDYRRQVHRASPTRRTAPPGTSSYSARTSAKPATRWAR